MFTKYRNWLINAPIRKKFTPMQVFIMLVILFIGGISVVSIYKINKSSQDIYIQNVTNRELISSIQEEILLIRIYLRDVIIENDVESVEFAYKAMGEAFDNLDFYMETMLSRLSGERHSKFQVTILEKEYYTVLINQIADAIIVENNHALAIALTDEVKPISAQFYHKLSLFLNAEIKAMEDALLAKEKSAQIQYIYISILCIVGIVFVVLTIKYSVTSIVKHILGLTKEVHRIADSKNMKADIPIHYFTNDEIGFIAKIIQKLKKLLLDYSVKDFLTGGYNATAYRSDLDELFDAEKSKEVTKRFWIVIFDMNNLKTINDTYGHVAGDTAIRSAYSVLSEIFSIKGKVYRVGGDEFISIISNSSEELIKESLAHMHIKIEEMSKKIELNFSIASGYGEFVGTSLEEFELFHTQIDMKMYENKDTMKATSRINARVRN